ncbi:TauD/TfdA family dioxygenase [Streptomyces sp. NPDC049906]|uniref:TauD/TfdA family dioxygenase n=1 Tax=Streptomyces sp. NPDC049906 TaxID=3155656 RepID=UPI0034264A9E
MTTRSLTSVEVQPEPFTTDSGRLSTVMQLLHSQGMVTVEGLDTRTKVLAFAQQVMSLVPHRDSDSDGLTTISDRGAASRRPELAGLGAGELLAHTERSSLPCPPRLMLLVCQQPALSGGDVLLTDGRWRGPHGPRAHGARRGIYIWITVYVVIVGVALLHPRRSRRREAREILDCHLPVPRTL